MYISSFKFDLKPTYQTVNEIAHVLLCTTED